MKDPKIVWVVEIVTDGSVYGEIYKHKWVALVVAGFLMRQGNDDKVTVTRKWVES
jgi:hypothetical protein